MRTVRIDLVCDACQAWHNRETTDGVKTVSASGTQTLELCPSHRADLAPVLSLIAEWGASPEKSKRKTVRPTQPEKDVAPEPTKNRRGGARARARRADSPETAPS